mgnify:CR=1 FL=1
MLPFMQTLTERRYQNIYVKVMHHISISLLIPNSSRLWHRLMTLTLTLQLNSRNKLNSASSSELTRVTLNQIDKFLDKLVKENKITYKPSPSYGPILNRIRRC